MQALNWVSEGGRGLCDLSIINISETGFTVHATQFKWIGYKNTAVTLEFLCADLGDRSQIWSNVHPTTHWHCPKTTTKLRLCFRLNLMCGLLHAACCKRGMWHLLAMGTPARPVERERKCRRHSSRITQNPFVKARTNLKSPSTIFKKHSELR